MTPMKQLYLAGLLLVLAILSASASYFFYRGAAQQAVIPTGLPPAPSAPLNQPRPDLRLPDLQGVVRNIGEWDGKVVVVNFWATWCPPCKREIPTFIKLQDIYGPRGVQFIGVAIDDDAAVRDYVKTMGINYPVLIGDSDAIDTSKRYGNHLGALPYTAIIDRAGKITYVQYGELTADVAEQTIKPLL